MKTSIVSGKIGYWLLALTICLSAGFSFLASAKAYDLPGLKLDVYADKEHTDLYGLKFRLGVDPVMLLIVISNEAGVPVVTARGFSQVELYKSLIVTDPRGVQHFLGSEDDAHAMPSLYTINDKDWELAEILPQVWARSVKITDLREKVPTMNTTAGWFTIEAQQPFVRFAATGNDEELGLIGLVDNPDNWSDTLKSNTLQIYVAPSTGAKVQVQVLNTGVNPAQPLAQVPVKILRNIDIPSGSALAAAWETVEPVLTGTTDFQEGKAVWKSESSCLVNDNYTVLAKYGNQIKSEPIPSTQTGWGDGCEGLISKIVNFASSPGDLDGDGDVDLDDVNTVLFYRNKPLSQCPRCDIDGDTKITVLDSRKIVLMCTRPGCATK